MYKRQVHTPILTGSDCEGAGEMFRVTALPAGEKDLSKDFFGRQANLTVSGQLEAEALALGLGRVYTFGPTFRAENSNTPRHAAEFWMIEPEMAFAELEDIMELGEGLTRHVVDHALTRCESDLKLFDNFVDKGLIDRLKGMLAQPFARVSYRDAIHILEDSGKEFTFPVAFGVDLQTEHERFLAEEHFRRPVIVYDYPKEIKAFYMRGNDDGETVAAMDVLVPRIGELIGGSQREERLDKLLARIAEMGQKPEDYWWYLDLRRFGKMCIRDSLQRRQGIPRRHRLPDRALRSRPSPRPPDGQGTPSARRAAHQRCLHVQRRRAHPGPAGRRHLRRVRDA